MINLRKIIKTTIKEFLNESIIVYHGSEDNIIGDFKNINPNITGFYFSNDYENAKTYGKFVKNIF